MTAAKAKTETDWKTWAIAIVFSLTAGFLGIQWQSALDAAHENEKDLEQLFDSHKNDIARLDESNRNRRNQIADLEERIARVEERTGS